MVTAIERSFARCQSFGRHSMSLPQRCQTGKQVFFDGSENYYVRRRSFSSGIRLELHEHVIKLFESLLLFDVR